MLIILCLLIKTSNCILEVPKIGLSSQMIAYLQKTTISLSDSFDTIGLVGTVDEYTSVIVDYLLKYRYEKPILIGNRNLDYLMFQTETIEATRNLLCFLETHNHFEVTLQHVKTVPFFIMTGWIQFIIGQPVQDRIWLNSTMEYLWKHNVINFVVVYQLDQTVEVIGYNPFNKTKYNLTNYEKVDTIYPVKLNNLYGTKLFISYLCDTPRNRIIDGRLIGEDYNWIPLLEKKLNATVVSIMRNGHEEIKEDLVTGVSNFSLARHFAYSENDNIIQAGYPYLIDYASIAVPSARPRSHFNSLFLDFDAQVWLILIATVLAVCIIYNVMSRYTGSKICVIASTFLVIQCFLNNVNGNSVKGRGSVRILMGSWIYFSLIMGIGFNTVLRDSLMEVKYARDINDLAEVNASGIPLWVEGRMMKVISNAYPPISNQLVNMPNVTHRLMSTTTIDIGYVLPLSIMKLIDNRRGVDGRYHFHVIQEKVLPGHSVYNFPINSPYKEHNDA